MTSRQVSGMVDDIVVPHGSKVGIPDAKDLHYQTSELEGVYGEAVIDVDGHLTFIPRSLGDREGGYCIEAASNAAAMLSGTYSSDDLDLIGEDITGYWWELTLKVVNNQVVRVKGYGEVLYDAEAGKVKQMPILAEHDHAGNVRVTAAWLEWYKTTTGVDDEEANFVASTAIGSVMNALSVHDQVQALVEKKKNGG